MHLFVEIQHQILLDRRRVVQNPIIFTEVKRQSEIRCFQKRLCKIDYVLPEMFLDQRTF